MNKSNETATVPFLATLYTNHRGVTDIRYIVPIRVYYGSTEWHPEPQWLMEAFCLDKEAIRIFALDCMVRGGAVPTPPITTEKYQSILARHWDALSERISYLAP